MEPLVCKHTINNENLKSEERPREGRVSEACLQDEPMKLLVAQKDPTVETCMA